MGRLRVAAALSAVQQVPELVRDVGHGAGFRAALAFSETSKGYAQCIQPVLGDLRMLAPAQLCVVGGSCNLRVFARLDLYVLELSIASRKPGPHCLRCPLDEMHAQQRRY
jgi:hypothetical protein